MKGRFTQEYTTIGMRVEYNFFINYNIGQTGY